jgi:hypothetical protein
MAFGFFACDVIFHATRSFRDAERRTGKQFIS